MDSISKLQIKTALRIAKPMSEVFEAIVDPEKMSHYFISKSTGRMEEGAVLQWNFPEMEMSFPIEVKKILPNRLVSYTWGSPDGSETLVEIRLKAVSDNITFVEITEGEKAPSQESIEWLQRNTEGWANFLACLKAYLEYGINLRQGAFDPSQMPTQEA